MERRRDALFFWPLALVTLVTPALAQAPSTRLPAPSLRDRAELGSIAVAQSRYLPDTDPSLGNSISGPLLQELLRQDILKQVSGLKGYTFAAAGETAPTLLEVRVERVSLAKDSLIDDSPSLVLRARARLVQPAYGRSVYDQKLEYRSPKRASSEWSKNEDAMVHREIGQGLKELAQKAADDIFLVYDAPAAP